MRPHVHPLARRLILIGTPLLTGILLLFHPRPDPAQLGLVEPLAGIDVYTLMAPKADRFLVVHALFAPALALLSLSVILILEGVRGIAADISRASAFIFGVTYIMYETIIGTVTGLLVRGAAKLPPGEQAIIGEGVYRNLIDPLFGDLPSILSGTAWLSWVFAVTLAAYALRRAGKPWGACLLLGLSFIFISHASSLGLIGMLLFLFAVIQIERAGSPVAPSVDYETVSVA